MESLENQDAPRDAAAGHQGKRYGSVARRWRFGADGHLSCSAVSGARQYGKWDVFPTSWLQQSGVQITLSKVV